MKPILTLAAHTFREQFRNRSIQVAFLFAGLLLYASLLLGALAIEQETRVLFDFGLGFIELMALVLAVYGASTVVLKEIESKTIYLILTRPVSRAVYLLGRYAGMVLSTYAIVLGMAALHLVLLFLKGWSWQGAYLVALYSLALKIALAAAMAFFASLATTSVLSGLTMVGILWTLGHFVPELSFLARQAPHEWMMLPLLAIARIIPNMRFLEFADRLSLSGAAIAEKSIPFSTAYAAAYSGICLLLAFAWLREKEF